jgi:predicted alpha/beta superfamily hydrolase
MVYPQRLTLIPLLFSSLILSQPATAEKSQVKVEFYVSVPATTDPAETVYLVGNLPQAGNWQANGVAMKRLESGEHFLVLELPRGQTLEYKVTRGSWETVEKGAAGEELHNRTLELTKDTVERITVAGWRSDAAAVPTTMQASTITGDVRVHDAFESKLLQNRRRLLVYLPPGYEKNPDARYPVLYMQDGQNLFDQATSFAGEWRADETADRLIAGGEIEPIIIVGIENTPERVSEYTPAAVVGNGGRGREYLRFVVEEVKPLIDRTYRTLPGREHTGIAGSSLGGLISLYAVQQYPGVFGRCGAVSPSLWWGTQQFLKEAREDAAWARGSRIWLDMGTAENDDPERAGEALEEAAELADVLQRSGLVRDRDFVWKPIDGGRHNEAAWADRLGQILIFLYPKRS